MEERFLYQLKELCITLLKNFFSVNYQNISKKRKDEIESNFKLRCMINKTKYSPRDSDETWNIVNQIENSLYTILDRSLENNTEDQDRTRLVVRGMLRGIPYLGHAIDALLFGKN